MQVNRAKAIASGELSDYPIEELRRKCGLPIHCALTSKLYLMLKPDEFETLQGEDIHARCWDLLHAYHARARNGQGNMLRYDFRVKHRDGKTKHMRLGLWSITVICGPGDQGEPVLTFALSEELL